MDELQFQEITSRKPGVWFSFEVLKGNEQLATFETQIDKGYCLEGQYETVYTIYKLDVNKKYRRQGVGSQIIDYCRTLAIHKKVNKLACWIQPIDSEISELDLKHFYLGSGFRMVSDKQTGELYAVLDF